MLRVLELRDHQRLLIAEVRPSTTASWSNGREPGDPVVEGMLAQYFAELLEVMPDFDADRASPPAAGDFVWPKGTFVVVLDDEEPIACGALRRLSSRTGELRRRWVRPAWRGKGAGRFLLDALEALAGEMRLTELCLDTNRVLTRAQALYRAAGYREVPPYNDNDNANAVADCWMAKSLLS